jgi:Domain of unknown function (DUF1992)
LIRQLPQWENGTEKQIREAQARGEFDNLPGQGKPLPSGSWGGGDWALAYHILKQAGETLPWIALANEIEAAQERLARLLRDAKNLAPAERARARERYLREAAALDRSLQEYAFLVPSRRLERGRFPAHIAARRFDEATRSG